MENEIIQINLTDEARTELSSLLKDEADGSFVRIWVSGGGCSGLQYQMVLDTEKDEDDTTIDSDGLTVVVDRQSAQYLNGITIEYQNDGELHTGFKINNPNFKNTCGCGSSFQANEEQTPTGQSCQGCKT